jgi:heat-inducible transcriptional repressor
VATPTNQNDTTVLDQRKASILRAVVEEYIDSAQPVGSGHVASAPGVEVSPATVRNEMAQLEHDGYLVQPHTSAGRIPTEKGYRYFVDSLVSPGPLEQDAAQQVKAFFNKAHGEIEQMLSDTTRLLSDLTSSAAVVVGHSSERATVRSVQLVGLAPRVVLLVLVLSNGSVEKRTIELDDDVDEATVTRASAHVDSHLRGRHVEEITGLGPSGTPAADVLVDATKAAMASASDDQVFVGGTARMAGSFEAVETIREVLGILEQQLVVVTLVRDVLDRGLSVAIGSETGMAPLAECALVVAPYAVEGEPAGTIGVLGPTRMNYPQALAAVAVVSKRLGHRLSEG